MPSSLIYVKQLYPVKSVFPYINTLVVAYFYLKYEDLTQENLFNCEAKANNWNVTLSQKAIKTTITFA